MPKYCDKLMKIFDNPFNVGKMDENDPNVGVGHVGSVQCGDEFWLYLKIGTIDNTQVITDAKFQCYGCASAIASASLMTTWIIGKTLDEALKIKNTQMVEELELPGEKIHCSVMVEDSISAAIENWRKKNGQT